jgi:hypothetical protein
MKFANNGGKPSRKNPDFKKFRPIIKIWLYYLLKEPQSPGFHPETLALMATAH